MKCLPELAARRPHSLSAFIEGRAEEDEKDCNGKGMEGDRKLSVNKREVGIPASFSSTHTASTPDEWTIAYIFHALEDGMGRSG